MLVIGWCASGVRLSDSIKLPAGAWRSVQRRFYSAAQLVSRPELKQLMWKAIAPRSPQRQLNHPLSYKHHGWCYYRIVSRNLPCTVMEFGIFACFPINKLNSVEIIMNQSALASIICCSQYEYAVGGDEKRIIHLASQRGRPRVSFLEIDMFYHSTSLVCTIEAE